MNKHTDEVEIETKEINTPSNKWVSRLKNMGWAAFLFFLIKGLIWLAVFFGLGKYFTDLF